MLKLPGKLTADTFLERHWQKRALVMPGALQQVRPSITRNELGWLATLDDVESRLVFVNRDSGNARYRVATGPFDAVYLQHLPQRDWTLLVHDVDKHLPTMRALFKHVPFIPTWRIDDLMVSFAAPGGGVGPHRDNYDVFLVQGTGVRNWRFTSDAIAEDRAASDDLALLAEFEGDESYDSIAGDVLYLPPGVAHWGTARRASITYSIGMRAPQSADLSLLLQADISSEAAYYSDADLAVDETLPGYLSRRAAKRASRLPGMSASPISVVAEALGRFATQPKDWLRPEGASAAEAAAVLNRCASGARLEVHGMALIAFDASKVYVNGACRVWRPEELPVIKKICAKRAVSGRLLAELSQADLLKWMLREGAFEIPENFGPYVKSPGAGRNIAIPPKAKNDAGCE